MAVTRSGPVQPRPHRLRHPVAIAALCGLTLALSARGTQDAIANGDTRTITIQHMHTKEVLTVTFRRWGQYDSGALEKLNWHLRDWRRDEPKRMNPRLFDLLWEVHRESGSSGPVNVVSAYRSPETNSMLRRRSRAVAKFSQHMQGNAMDFYIPGMSMGQVREVAMRMQRGGVGYYPTANTPFVHLDVGSVRSWPRMSRDQLARLFPDGKTVHLPAGGGTMPGYDLAYAEIVARGGSVGGHAGDEGEESIGGGGGFFAMLFGGGGRRSGGTQVAAASPTGEDDGGARAFLMGAPPAGETAGAAAGIRGRATRGRRTAEPQTQVAALTPTQRAPDPVVAVPAPAPVAEAPVPVRPVAAAAFAPTPAPAAVDAQKALEATIDRQNATRQTFASLPLPPRRPRDLPQILALANSEAAHPLPPRRPDSIGAPVQTAALADTRPPAARPAGEDAVSALNRKPVPTPPVQAAAFAPTGSVKQTPVIAVKPANSQAGALAAMMTAASKGQVVTAFTRANETGPTIGRFTGKAVRASAAN